MARITRDPLAPARIVEAAARAVAAHGIHGASMRVIAAEAGVTTGFITHYFADKHAVMEAMLEATNRAAARRVQRAMDSEDTALERLRAAADAMLPIDPQRRQEWQVWVAVWAEASKGDTLSIGYRQGWFGLRDMLIGLLDDAREERGLFGEVDSEHRADRLVTVLAGIGLLAGVERPGRVRDMARRMVAEELCWLGQPEPLS